MTLCDTEFSLSFTPHCRAQLKIVLRGLWISRWKIRLGKRHTGLFKIREVDRSLDSALDVKPNRPNERRLHRLDWLNAEVLLVSFLPINFPLERITVPISCHHLKLIFNIDSSLGVVAKLKVLVFAVFGDLSIESFGLVELGRWKRFNWTFFSPTFRYLRIRAEGYIVHFVKVCFSGLFFLIESPWNDFWAFNGCKRVFGGGNVFKVSVAVFYRCAFEEFL